jgi:ethanolamine utilization protein EutQ (cupin superfamily)
LQLADNSFDWTFNADEVLVVLEGELRLSGAGLDLKAGPGDAVRLSAGLSCTLTATGRVSCVYSAWPK